MVKSGERVVKGGEREVIGGWVDGLWLLLVDSCGSCGDGGWL